jgi:hypothetical protein
VSLIRTKAVLLLLVFALSACSSGSNAIVDTLQNVIPRGNGPEQARLNPAFRYLRVTIDGRIVLLALGDIDASPLGPIEVWYSADREVLRLQNGRIVGAAGVSTEWRNVVIPKLPSWSSVANGKDPISWVRIRDVMPDYRYGVRDMLFLRVVDAPGRSALQVLDAQKLIWFEESFQPPQVAGQLSFPHFGSSATLPPARYAMDSRDGKEMVVYGEQCLSRELCFTWQRWPVGE